jgi:hypothetical protein
MEGHRDAADAAAPSSPHGRIRGSSSKGTGRHEGISLEQLPPNLAERIRTDHPALGSGAIIRRSDLTRYRRLYIEELLQAEHGELTELDRRVAESLANQDTIAENIDAEYEERRTLGERLADQLADFGGSSAFILWFVAALFAWIAFNAAVPEPARFDPYPYILLNLILSCLAALQAPIIMMSQKRQDAGPAAIAER